MTWRVALLSLAVSLSPSAACASCGSQNCPIDLGLPWEHSVLTLDLSEQYIDQGQPRAGTQDVAIGAIPSPEDEVRTVNRITTMRILYQPSTGWSVSAALPYVGRYHEHVHNEPGLPPERQRWAFDGPGDAELLATHTIALSREGGRPLRLTAGIKIPTGKTHVEEFAGEEPEPPARPGNGAWTAILGAGTEWRITTRMPGGSFGSMPIRFSITGRAGGRGTERYRVGSELQTNLGAGYPLTRGIEFLLSGDVRIRAKDDPGDTDAEAGHTGGTWVYASPGLRVVGAGRTAISAVVQVPIYQRVNGINIVSKANLYLGVSRSIR